MSLNVRPEFSLINLPETWLEHTGSATVKVAVIDGPVDTDHPALRQTRISELPGSPDSQCTVKESFGCIHGTFVAGLLGANSQSETPGLCSGVTIWIRPIFCEAWDFSQCPVVTIEDLSQAIHQAIDARAHLINLSLALSNNTSEENLQPLFEAYDRAQQEGSIIIGAAGNHAARNGNPLFDHPWPIPVAAANSEGAPLPQTNLGGCISERGVMAPGQNVRSLAPGGSTRQMSGSSVATPFVTGSLALLWSRFPGVTAEQVRGSVRPPTDQSKIPPLFNYKYSYSALQNSMNTIVSDNNETSTTYPSGDASVQPQFGASDQSRESQNSAAISATAEPASIEPSASPEIIPQECSCNQSNSPTYIYALGIIKPVFPDEGVQQEFKFAAQELKQPQDAYYQVLSYKDPNGQQPYFYIAKSMRWVLEIDNVETYFLLPQSEFEFQELINSLEPQKTTVDPLTAIAVGVKGPKSPASFSRGISLPLVSLTQLFYFSYDTVISQISNTANLETQTVRDLLQQLQSMPNNGSSDGGRALNYIAYRFPEVYSQANQMINPTGNQSSYFLKSIHTKPSNLEGNRRITDAIFSFQQFDTSEEKSFYCSIDVSGQFPFLVTPIRPFVPQN